MRFYRDLLPARAAARRRLRPALLAAGGLATGLLWAGAAGTAAPPPPRRPVLVEVFENVPPGKELEPAGPPVDRYTQPAFGLLRTPTKYSREALPLDRSTPFVLRASLVRTIPAGTHEFRLRARGAARFYVDDRLILETAPQKPNTNGDDPVPPPPARTDSPIRPVFYPHQEVVKPLLLDGTAHRFVLVAVIGGKGLAPTPGELCVSFGLKGEVPRLLGGPAAPHLTDTEWEAYAAAEAVWQRETDTRRRRQASVLVAGQWEERHRRIRAWLRGRPAPAGPDAPATATAQRAPGPTPENPIDRLLGARLQAAKVRPTPPLDDLQFLRRLSLDVLGLIPTSEEVRAYLAGPPAERREKAIDRLLERPEWADHWVSYWQDVLAENPGILKPDLNNTGPFRWWLHQSFADNVPFDRFVTELVQMEGSTRLGAPAAFGQASLNDAPMAAKAHILSQAFLAQNLTCARCHDAPSQPYKQQQLFSLAAMLAGKPLAIPASSTVPQIEGFRKPLVRVSLNAGDQVAPEWPFPELVRPNGFLVPPADAGPADARGMRLRAAAMMISPDNERFAQVIVNRLWKRYMGRGLVEPVDDWTTAKPSHPEVLRYLARELLFGGYDLKRVARAIFSSEAYQRQPLPEAQEPGGPEARLFAGPYRRRMTAEQLVDSLYRSVGKQLDTEELNLSPAGDRPAEQFLNLGNPCRAWELAALSNERDRPALALPISQSIVDVLTAFGWRQSRQAPASVRDDAASPMQTLILANGIMGTRIVRLSDDSAFTELCLENRTLDSLVRETFTRVLSRPPSLKESRAVAALLGPHHAARRVKGAAKRATGFRTDRRVSWANHLSAEATVIRMEEERRLRLGDEPTKRLTPAFRERFEDFLWALVNSPEFVVVP